MRTGGDAACDCCQSWKNPCSKRSTILAFQRELKAMAINPSNDTPEQFKQLIEGDIVKFRHVVQAAHLKFED